MTVLVLQSGEDYIGIELGGQYTPGGTQVIEADNETEAQTLSASDPNNIYFVTE
jgi:uncharacterized protein YciI